MQNALVIVDTKPNLVKLSTCDILTFQDLNYIKQLKSVSFFGSWLAMDDDELVLTPQAEQELAPLLDTLQTFNKVVFALTPGQASDVLAGIVALAFDRHPIKLFSTGTQPVTGESMNALLPVTKHSVAAAFTQYQMDELWSEHGTQQVNRAGSKGSKLTLKQAMLLRYIYDRETDIERFKGVKTHQICIQVKTTPKKSKAFIVGQVGKEEIASVNLQYAKALISQIKDGEFVIKSVREKQVKATPPAPATTQSILADAERIFKYSFYKVFKILDKLYQGVNLGNKGTVSLISYYMTQSEFIDKDVINSLREYIYTNYGADYLPKRAISRKVLSVAGCAIYPLQQKLEPRKVKKHLSESQYNIYTLIWQRFVASQMSKSVHTETKIVIEDNKQDACLADSLFTKIVFRGFRQIFDDGALPAADSRLSEIWRPGYKVKVEGYDICTQTNASAERYAYSDLLKIWLEQGGRVDDFEHSAGMLFANQFIEKKNKRIRLTPTGFKTINALLAKFFGLIQPGFIQRLDNMVTAVACGKQSFQQVLREVDKVFTSLVLTNTNATDCPVCGGKLVPGQDGDLVCEHYPLSCVYNIKKAEVQKEICQACGADLTVREGKYGKFWACTRYPRCNYTKDYTLNINCPAEGCDGKIVEKRSAKGNKFYGCSRYPECKFASSKEPVNMICNKCGNLYLVRQPLSDIQEAFHCPKCGALYNEHFMTIS